MGVSLQRVTDRILSEDNIFFSPKHPDHLWDPSIFMFCGCRTGFLSLWQGGWGVVLNTHLYLVPRLRLSRAVRVLPLELFSMERAVVRGLAIRLSPRGGAGGGIDRN